MRFLLNLLLSGVAVFVAAYIVPGVGVDSFITALIVSVALAVINATLGELLHFVVLPINWLSLGIIGLIINVLMVRLADALLGGFSTSSFWSAAIFALVLSIILSLLGVRFKK